MGNTALISCQKFIFIEKMHKSVTLRYRNYPPKCVTLRYSFNRDITVILSDWVAGIIFYVGTGEIL